MAQRASTKPLHSSRIGAAAMTSSHTGISEVPAVLRSRSCVRLNVFLGAASLSSTVWLPFIGCSRKAALFHTKNVSQVCPPPSFQQLNDWRLTCFSAYFCICNFLLPACIQHSSEAHIFKSKDPFLKAGCLFSNIHLRKGELRVHCC